MQKSVLSEIIRSLEKKEIRELNKWLLSPAHNQRQDVIKLFEFLVKNLPNGDEGAEKTKAWKFVFPAEPYDDAYLRQVMYFLLKAIEEYLVFVDVANDKVQFQIALTRIYRGKKIEKAYKQSYRIATESLQNQPLRNGYFLLQRFLLEQEEYEHRMSITQNSTVNLQETADALEKWFLAERFRISNSMLAHRAVFQKAHYESGLLDDSLKFVAEKEILKEPAVAVYYYAYLAITNPDEEQYYEQFEHLIHNFTTYFDQAEVRTLYIAALNYCVPKINKGRLDFSRRAFELYRKGIENGYLLENGTLSRFTFGNAVAAALKIGEYDWAEKFIEDFTHLLDDKQKESTVNFNLSRIYFERGDYSKAQKLLTRFEYDYFFLNIIAKTMLLKIYFETDEYDAFESLLESLRTYLQRKEALDATRKASYKNMISLMKKLLQLNIFSRAQKESFRELVQQTNPLAERDWFMKQLDRK
jgi:hypothetical protein